MLRNVRTGILGKKLSELMTPTTVCRFMSTVVDARVTDLTFMMSGLYHCES